MDYQMVLRFPFSNGADYDILLDLEDALEESLPDWIEVDGHDAGTGEMNVFVLSDDPTEAFAFCKSVIAEKGLLEKLSAGYRPLDDEKYVRLWPVGSNDEFNVA